MNRRISCLSLLLMSVSSIVFMSCKDDHDDDGSDPIKSYLSCPDSNHPHAIDLGIGVKWACCNVGASTPEQYGGYYAWGETEEKSVYTSTVYQYFDINGDYMDIGSDIAGTSYDVAHAKWGGGWHMPSSSQIQQLIHKCSSEWKVFFGVKGRVFTGPSGAKIFLPAAGNRWNSTTTYDGKGGYYWSSTQNPDESHHAYYLYFDSYDPDTCHYYLRYCGRSVRPVIE